MLLALFSNGQKTVTIIQEQKMLKSREENESMKKLVSLILALAMVLCVVSFASADETYRVAMITDSGDITDQSLNQTT